MSDNPQPGLYGARYSVRLVGRVAGTADRSVTVVGRHCEAGDVLVRHARPPVVAVGGARPLIRRETEDDLLRRDLG